MGLLPVLLVLSLGQLSPLNQEKLVELQLVLLSQGKLARDLDMKCRAVAL